jgi:hypothetical protein
VLQELEDQGVPAEAVDRMRSMGLKSFLKGKSKGLPQSVAAAAGDRENVKLIKETVRMGRAAVKGFDERQLQQQWKQMLGRLGDDIPVQLKARLRGLDPKAVARAAMASARSAASEGSQTALSVLKNVSSGPTGWTWARDAASEIVPSPGPGSAIVPSKGGALARVAGEAAGVAGEAAPGLLRRMMGRLGKGTVLGLGITAAIEAPRLLGILGRGRRAEQRAAQGPGPMSSHEFLRDIVAQQEAIARRKATLQTLEPDLFNEVTRILATTGAQRPTLTPTERRIGNSQDVGTSQRTRSRDQVEFLLDQLLGQMGNVQ